MSDTAGTGESAEGATGRQYVEYPDLRGEHVLITGGGSGIGAYLVDAFAAQGAEVSFLSLPEPAARALCDDVERSRGVRPCFAPCDLRNVGEIERIVRELGRARGAFRVLINNAARDDRHTLESLDPAGWDDAIATNLRPYHFTARAAAPGMVSLGAGSIINLGSNSMNLGLAGYPAYVTAKAGIIGLTRALARELGPHEVRVNALIPGWVMTRRQREKWASEEALAQCLAAQCLKDTLEGSDIAEAALFLASRASRMITGQSLIVDGGRAHG